MLTYKFLVAKNDIKGLPGLEKGTPIIRAAVEIVEGYEYDVWHRLDDGMPARTRIEHRGEFTECEVDGETPNECREKALALASGIGGGK